MTLTCWGLTSLDTWPLDLQHVVCCVWSVLMICWKFWYNNKIRILYFNFQCQLKVHSYAQLSEHVYLLWFDDGILMNFWLTLDISSTRQNESKCPKTYSLRCNSGNMEGSQNRQKVFFYEKWPLNEKEMQNFTTKWFAGTWIYVCLPSFMEIGKAKVTKMGHIPWRPHQWQPQNMSMTATR